MRTSDTCLLRLLDLFQRGSEWQLVSSHMSSRLAGPRRSLPMLVDIHASRESHGSHGEQSRLVNLASLHDLLMQHFRRWPLAGRLTHLVSMLSREYEGCDCESEGGSRVWRNWHDLI